MSSERKRKSGQRPKKRKFMGNRFTNSTHESASMKKLNVTVDENEAIEISSCLKSLYEDIRSLYDNNIQSDVVLICGDRKFRAHRAILSTRSKVFAAMFENDIRENREGIVNITDIEPSVLDQFLRYLYTGEISDLSVVSARKIYALADKYAVEALKIKCAFFSMDSYRMDIRNESAEAKDIQPETNLTESQVKEEHLLKDLFLSDKWQSFSQACPELASEMCKPVINRKHSSEVKSIFKSI